MYLVDTNVISEFRKGDKADKGVIAFFDAVEAQKETVFLSVITVGELRRGIEKLRYRNDTKQAEMLDSWLSKLLTEYSNNILEFDKESAQVWGYLRVPNHEHLLDKQIAAIALTNGLTVVTRNIDDFSSSGVQLLNPFSKPRKIKIIK
jgi:predicted nucleic acid-binding protein